MPRTMTRVLTAGIVALLLTTIACSRSDEETAGGAASPTIPPAEDVTPTPTGNTGAATGASGLSGSLGETGATGATGDATSNAVSVTAVDYEFQLEGGVPPGEAGFVLTNEGDEPHELQVLQLTDGKTLADLEALVAEGVPGRPPSWVTPVTGTFARPGQTSEPAQGELESGQTYVFACFVTTKKGVTHAELGMLEEVTVA
jgi:hypothetical protein